MIEFRCFRNDDPPRLADVWRAADLGPRAIQPMTAALLEGGGVSAGEIAALRAAGATA